MRQFSSIRLLYFLIGVLLCFLFLASSMIGYQQQDLLRKNTYRDVRGDLDLIADASLEPLLKSDYVSIRNFIKQWGKKREEFHELRFVAPNGFVIAEYKSAEAPIGGTFTLTKDVMIEQTKLATIYILGDYCEADIMIARLRNQLILAAVILTVLLGAAVWFVFRKMAIVPLEDAVTQRTQALSDVQQEFDHLAEHSPT